MRPGRRRFLRWMWRGFSVTWMTGFLVLVWALPARADNCSVFTDCFGQFGAAGIAALGLTFLAGLSLVVDFIPIVGDVKGLIEMGTGRDLFTGEKLAAWERSLGLIGLIPGGDLLRLGRFADDLGGAMRHADDFGDLGGTRRLDTGPGTSGTRAGGDTVPSGSHRGEIDSLADAYTGASRSERVRISEQLGELGGADYLETATGRNLDIMRPTSDADVADLADQFDAGVAWDQPVAFGGSRATNLVYFDGQTLHIVEAKGGAGAYGDRVSSLGIGDSAGRISQTNPQYPLDVAADMSNSKLADGRNAIGDIITDAYDMGNVSYVGVRTAGHNTGGEVVTYLEHTFLAP